MKKWCRHIVWDNGAYLMARAGWIFSFEGEWEAVPRTWKACPCCLAERPTKANIAAARLRAAMDAGDEE